MLINQTKTYYRETGEIAKSKVSVNMIYWKEFMKTNIFNNHNIFALKTIPAAF
jgi:hypothetical protein